MVQHIKIQQIDIRVYSEEVEPTGILPQELSRDRFHRASKSNVNSDISNGNNNHNINNSISTTQSSLNRLNIRAETGNGLLRYK